MSISGLDFEAEDAGVKQRMHTMCVFGAAAAIIEKHRL